MFEYKWFGGELHGVVEGNLVVQFFTDFEGVTGRDAALRRVDELNNPGTSETEIDKLEHERGFVKHDPAKFTGGDKVVLKKAKSEEK